MHGEHPVVGGRLQEVAFRRQQLEADEHGEDTAEREEGGDRDQVEDRDPLVVPGQQPRLPAVAVVEVAGTVESDLGWVHGRHGSALT